MEYNVIVAERKAQKSSKNSKERRQSEKSNGSLAQLGERLPYKQRVGGSSPSTSTILHVCGEYFGNVLKRPGSSVG